MGRLRKGYHCRQVDAFLNHVEVSLGGVFPPPIASEVRQAGFELVHHGYDVEQVDAYLDQLEEKVVVAQGMTSGRRGKADPDSEAAYLREQLGAPYMQRFPRAGMLHRGYLVDDVDDFVDRVVAALDGQGSLTLTLAVPLGLLTGSIVGRLLRAPIAGWMEALTPPLLFALAAGKLIGLLGASGQGMPSDVAWATAYVGPGPWGSLAADVPSHPAQAYEAILVPELDILDEEAEAEII